jgi:Lrp/AsnC family leucine-responsive transcriptional regulator
MIDKTDLKILKILQENAQLTFKEISQKINLSITPVHDRIKRMEKDGVIEKYVTIINKKKIGSSLIVYCNITLAKQTKNNFSEFEHAVLEFPEVMECSVVSGEFDYILKIHTRDMESYNEFYQQKLSVLESVIHINSFFVMAEVKNTTIFPLE